MQQQTFFAFLVELNKQRDDAISYRFTLRLHVADPATFLASNGVLGTLFSSENSLFIQVMETITSESHIEIVLHPY